MKICNAAICIKDSNTEYKNQVVWYAGEEVCSCRPQEKFQRVQIEINRTVNQGKFKHLDTAYTANELDKGR